MSPLVHHDVPSIINVLTCAAPAHPVIGRLAVSGLATPLSGNHKQGAMPCVALCSHWGGPPVFDLLKVMSSRPSPFKASVAMSAQQQQCWLCWKLNQGLACMALRRAVSAYSSAKLLLQPMSAWEVLLLLQMVLSGCEAGQRQSSAYLVLLQAETVLHTVLQAAAGAEAAGAVGRAEKL